MRILIRCIAEHASLWRVWSPLLILSLLLPLPVLAMPLVEKKLIDDVLLKHQLALLPTTAALYGALWVVATFGGIARTVMQTYLRERVAQHLRQRLFVHYGELSLAFSHREHNGRTMALFQNDVPRVSSLVSATIIPSLASVFGVLVGVAVMLSLSWQLSIAAGLAPLVLAAVAGVVTRPLRPAALRVQEKVAELSERLQENLAGIREVAAFGREESQAGQFGKTLGELVGLRMRVTFMDSVFQVGQSVFTLAVTLVILGYGGYLYLQGQTTLGTLIAMQTIFGQTFMPATQLFGMVKQIQTSLASGDRIYAFLDEQPRVQDFSAAQAPGRIDGAVRFDRVSFGYRPNQLVLHDVSLSARPGDVVALVGPSGAGKSTLMSLLTRFYDPVEGSVQLDGIDLRDLRLAALRQEIGIVFQDTFLFATTVRENIAFGRPGATEEQIRAAARAANAWEFVESLPDGWETQVGQRGVQLSEGQKQRLAIARAFLRDPRVLILDEPTSALDARAERLIQDALDNLMQGRTTFVIAHRLATVRRADQILVIDHGRVVERGTHAELIARAGLYRELFELQFGGSVGVPGRESTPVEVA